MQPGPRLLYFQPVSQTPLMAPEVLKCPAILDSGFSVLRIVCSTGLYRLVDQHVIDGKIAVALVLAGSHHENCAAAAYARAMHATLPIVAVTDSDPEDALIELLHSGVDLYCPANASGRLMTAIVTRLLASAMARCAETAAIAPPDRATYWGLDEQGWVLRAPQGACISLTTGERAFISTLLAAAGLRAAHEQLASAVASSYYIASSRHGTPSASCSIDCVAKQPSKA